MIVERIVHAVVFEFVVISKNLFPRKNVLVELLVIVITAISVQVVDLKDIAGGIAERLFTFKQSGVLPRHQLRFHL